MLGREIMSWKNTGAADMTGKKAFAVEDVLCLFY